MPKVRGKQPHRGNYFSVLSGVDTEKARKAAFSLKPSIIATTVFDETKGFHEKKSAAAERASDKLKELKELGVDAGLDDEDEAACLRDDYVPVHERQEKAAAAVGAAAGAASSSALTAAAFGDMFGSSAAARAPPLGGAGTGGRAGGGASIDLASVASEIAATGAKMEASGAAAAWDFSGFASTATETAAKIASDAAARAAAAAASTSVSLQHVKAVAADESDAFKEKLDRVDLSHKQRVRRIMDMKKSSDFVARQSSKLARNVAKKKAWNKAKNS